MDKTDLQRQTTQIKIQLANLQDLIKDVRAVKEEAAAIRTVVRGKKTESTNRTAEITDLKQLADDLVQKIRKQAALVTEHVSAIEQYYPSFAELRDKMIDEGDGLAATLGALEGFKAEAHSIRKEADNYLVEVKGRLKEIEGLREEAVVAKETIDQLAADSESLKEGIKEHLDLVTPSTLRSEFKKREKRLQRVVYLWLGVSLGSLAIFAYSLLYVFDALNAVGFSDWRNWYKYLFTMPILVVVLWALRNYGFERRLLEKYAFKAVVSTSLTSYIKLLTDNFPKRDDKVLEFTMDALGKIYDEPYQDTETKARGHISFLNIIKADMELDEKIKGKINEKMAQKVGLTAPKTI